MKTTIEEVGDKIIVTLDGELDTAAAVGVDHKMTPLYEGKQKEIVIDCTRLEYIASSGLRILLRIQKQAQVNQNHVVLKNLSENNKKVFELTGFDSIFDFE